MSFPPFLGGGGFRVSVDNGDPAIIGGMALWVDERAFAPDGSAASTIELNDVAAKAYAEIIDVAPMIPEQDRYFGQSATASRPVLFSYNGWRCPSYHHDDTGGFAGTYLKQINYNVVEPTIIGTARSFLPPGSEYTAIAIGVVPPGMVDGHNYILQMVQGQTWEMYIARETAGNHAYAHIFHQGSAINANPFVDIFAGGFSAPGDLLAFGAWWDGTQVQMDVMRASDFAVVSTFATAVDGLGTGQVNAYRLVLGGFDGRASWKGPLLAHGVCQRNMGQTARRALMQQQLVKYSTPTVQTWPDGATPMDPLTYEPTKLWAPGSFNLTGALINSIPNGNPLGPPHAFGAAGAQRPTRVFINGTIPAIQCNGVDTWLDQLTGTEADINSDVDSFAVIGLIVCTQQIPGYPSAAVTIGGDSILRVSQVYSSGGVRGPLLAFSIAGGPHGNLALVTLADAWIPGQLVSYINQSNVPNVTMDGGFPIVRGVSNGEQQSDEGGAQTGNRAGIMRMGRYTLAGGVMDAASPFTPPYFWGGVKMPYKIQQAIRRKLNLDAALALP